MFKMQGDIRATVHAKKKNLQKANKRMLQKDN